MGHLVPRLIFLSFSASRDREEHERTRWRITINSILIDIQLADPDASRSARQ